MMPGVSRRVGPGYVVAVLVALLAASVTLAVAVGVVRIPYLVTLRVIAAKLLPLGGEPAPGTFEAIIWSVRMPRVLTAGLAGFALAVCGAAMQGLFRNPLASPGITGVSSGASLGAAIAIFLGLQLKSPWFVPAGGFAGALAAAAVVYLLSTQRGKTDPATLLLAGVAVSALASAVLSAIYQFSNDFVMREIVYWLMGNLSGRRWEHVVTIGPLVLAGGFGLMAFAAELNIMAAGEDDARAMGVSVERTKRWILALVAVVTGAAISVVGLIGFVGLIVPHTMRIIVGPDHRRLLPASGLLGASFLILCDVLARTLFAPVELQTGIVTAFFGVPFFLALLVRRRDLVGWS